MPSVRRLMTARVLVGLVVLATAAPAGAWFLSRDDREYTTSSEKAYKHFMLGTQASRNLYSQEALDHYQNAIAEDPEFAMAWLRVAQSEYDMQDLDKSRECLAKAQAQIHRVSEIEKLFIEIFAARLDDNGEGREQLYTRLIEEYPTHEKALFTAAIRAFRKGDSEEALAYYEQIARDFPHRGDVYNMIGYANADLRRWSAAVEAFQKYTFLYPDQPNPHDSLGELYLRTGLYQAAVNEFEKALAIKPDFGWSAFHKAYAQMFMGRYESALATLAGARESGGLEEHWLDVVEGLIRIEAGDHGRALAVLEQRAEKSPKRTSAPFLICRVLAEQKKVNAAEKQLEAFMEMVRESLENDDMEPEASWGWNELKAYISSSQGDWEAVVEYLAKADGEADSWMINQRMRDERIEALVRTERYDEAVVYASEVFSVNPHQPEANYWCGRALEELGRITDAIGRYRTALKTWEGADAGIEPRDDALRRLNRLEAQASVALGG